MAEIGLCDVCNAELPSSDQRLLSALELRGAVARGFDPVHLGLAPGSDLDRFAGPQQSDYFKGWIELVNLNETDWAICTRCWTHLKDYVGSTSRPRPAGANRSAGATPKAFARTSMALESFRCTKCGHPFGEDNRFYPNNGVLVPIERQAIKCARCGATIVEFRRIGRWIATSIMGSIAGFILGAVISAFIFSKPESLVLILCAAVGVVGGLVFDTWGRADIKRRLARVAAQVDADERRIR